MTASLAESSFPAVSPIANEMAPIPGGIIWLSLPIPELARSARVLNFDFLNDLNAHIADIPVRLA
ncbi:hypothetical protein HQ447_12695 [bacterium]|nr:hypothetical protein [bacterium]